MPPAPRTTSACAENTASVNWLLDCMRNYLRVRGEYRSTGAGLPATWELPPRARRIPGMPLAPHHPCGTTSACAENTGVCGGRKPPTRNYLRVRGEYLDTAQAMAKHVELPPRARRIRVQLKPLVEWHGTTSACAENTDHLTAAQSVSRNYLRVRGEYITIIVWPG